MTAHYLVHSTGRVKPGDKVLVHTAAGGTGSLVCQMAKNAGNNNNNNNNGNFMSVFECTIVNLDMYRQFTNAA